MVATQQMHLDASFLQAYKTLTGSFFKLIGQCYHGQGLLVVSKPHQGMSVTFVYIGMFLQAFTDSNMFFEQPGFTACQPFFTGKNCFNAFSGMCLVLV